MGRTWWRTESKVLGAALLKDEADVVLQIGRDAITRQQVATVLGHTHVAAVRRLAPVVGNGHYRSLRDAVAHVTVDELADRKGVGATTLFCWMTLIELAGRNAVAWLYATADRDGKVRRAVTVPTRQRQVRRQHRPATPQSTAAVSVLPETTHEAVLEAV